MQKSGQLASLFCVVFFGFVSLSLPYPIFSPLFLHPESPFTLALNLSESWRAILLGATLAAYPLAQFFGSPVLGGLSDTYGRKRLLILTMIGTGLGYFLSGLAIIHKDIALLICSRLMTGFFEGNMGIASACIADLKYDRYLGLGAILAISALGYLVGPLLGGFLCDKSLVSWFSYETPFFVGCAMAGLLALLIACFFKETRHGTIKKSRFVDEFNISKKFKLIFHKQILRNAFIAVFLLCLSIDCYYEFYPAFLVQEWGLTPKMIGLYSVTLSLALSIGALWIPNLIRKTKNPSAFRIPLLIIYALAMALVLFADNSFTLNLHFFVVGLCYSTINTILMVIISENAHEDEQGSIMGLQWGTRMLGDGASCIVGSFLLIKATALPIILCIFLSGATLLWIIFTKTEEKTSIENKTAH